MPRLKNGHEAAAPELWPQLGGSFSSPGLEEILLMCPFLFDSHACCSFYWGVVTLSEDILYEIKIPKLVESRRTLGCVIVFSERFCSAVGLEPASYVCK